MVRRQAPSQRRGEEPACGKAPSFKRCRLWSCRLNCRSTSRSKSKLPSYGYPAETLQEVAENLAEEVPITAQAGQLETLLSTHGLDTAATHYAQAFENFTAGNLEAANGQLRPALEEALVTLTQRATGWKGAGGGNAINTLDGKDYFEEGELDYFKGLWKISHGEGPHPGLTTEAEAEFRFHAITAAIYFLVHRLE